MVLADRISVVNNESGPFGAAKVLPNVSGVFKPDQDLFVFFQLSNFKIDPAQSAPVLVSEVG